MAAFRLLFTINVLSFFLSSFYFLISFLLFIPFLSSFRSFFLHSISFFHFPLETTCKKYRFAINHSLITSKVCYDGNPTHSMTISPQIFPLLCCATLKCLECSMRVCLTLESRRACGMDVTRKQTWMEQWKTAVLENKGIFLGSVVRA